MVYKALASLVSFHIPYSIEKFAFAFWYPSMLANKVTEI